MAWEGHFPALGFYSLTVKGYNNPPWLDEVTRLPFQTLVAQVPLAATSARAGRRVVVDGVVHQVPGSLGGAAEPGQEGPWEWGLQSWPHLLAGFPAPPSRGRCCLLVFGKEGEEDGARYQNGICGEAWELGSLLGGIPPRLFPSSFPGAPGLPLLVEEELLWAREMASFHTALLFEGIWASQSGIWAGAAGARPLAQAWKSHAFGPRRSKMKP